MVTESGHRIFVGIRVGANGSGSEFGETFGAGAPASGDGSVSSTFPKNGHQREDRSLVVPLFFIHGQMHLVGDREYDCEGGMALNEGGAARSTGKTASP